jgi:hypothetical protein
MYLQLRPAKLRELVMCGWLGTSITSRRACMSCHLCRGSERVSSVGPSASGPKRRESRVEVKVALFVVCAVVVVSMSCSLPETVAVREK